MYSPILNGKPTHSNLLNGGFFMIQESYLCVSIVNKGAG